MNKTEQQIKEFLEQENINQDSLSVDSGCISTSECCQLSDLLKLKQFLGFKDLSLQTGDCVWRMVPKSNDDLIQEANELLEKEEVELGYNHSIEDWLVNNFADDLGRIKWLKDYIEQIDCSNIKRSAILILGRFPRNSFSETREILSAALLDINLGVRDAAICSIENLGLFNLLQNHKEPVEWLAKYIDRLLKHYERPNT